MLRVTDLNAFYGEAHVLSDVSVEVNEGEVAMILGPNGHGKSTLLKSICGLVESVNGQVTFKGDSILGQSAEKIVNSGLIYIAENRELFPQMTVLENLKLGAFCKNARAREKENLEIVFDIFPRLANRQKQTASTMSGGEAKMLALARGMMSNPSFICMDEPSLGLQPSLRLEIVRIIRRIREEGKTVLLVEQNIPQITDITDRIYMLEEGKITFSGNKEETIDNGQLKELFLGM